MCLQVSRNRIGMACCNVHRCAVLAFVGLVLSCSAIAHCYELASARYQVSAALLHAIAQQESGGRSTALHANPNGSVDIGLMQINSGWIGVLGRHGIREQDLWDPCVSVLVGAWILRRNFDQLGHTTQALGAYNSTNPTQRERYASQVLRRLPPASATSR